MKYRVLDIITSIDVSTVLNQNSCNVNIFYCTEERSLLEFSNGIDVQTFLKQDFHYLTATEFIAS